MAISTKQVSGRDPQRRDLRPKYFSSVLRLPGCHVAELGIKAELWLNACDVKADSWEVELALGQGSQTLSLGNRQGQSL